MSKLLKLKRWLTIEEASIYLTGIFGESVQPHDIYRLAIDGSLRLSVVFLASYNYREAYRKTGEIAYESAPSLDGKSLVNLPIGGPVYETRNGDDYQMGSMVGYLAMDHPYSLPMIGGEIESVEHKYWEAQGITRGFTTDIDGVFVADEEKIYQVEDRVDPNDITRGFFPVGSLPDDVEFVVTPSDLLLFQNALMDDPVPTSEKPLASKERTGLLNIIGALLQQNNTKEAAIIDAILEQHPSVPGLKKRNLEEKFAAAKRSLASN